jgi:hypothetical protein
MAKLRLCGVSCLAWVLSLLASLGYFAADSMSALSVSLSSWTWNTTYTLLSLAFLVDAVLYLVEWWINEERRPRLITSGCWANIVNIVASSLYLLSSSLFFFYPQTDGQGLLARDHAIVQAALNFSAVLLFAIDALMFNSEYYNERAALSKSEKHDAPLLKEAHFYAELFNTLPSLGYLSTGLVQLFSLLDRDYTLGDLLRLRATMGQINVVFDALYALDALLLGWGWWLDYNAQFSVHEIRVLGVGDEESERELDSPLIVNH